MVNVETKSGEKHILKIIFFSGRKCFWGGQFESTELLSTDFGWNMNQGMLFTKSDVNCDITVY